MPCIPRIQSNIDGDFDQGKSLKYELSHGTRLQPRKIEVLAITKMEGFTMKHWNVWNCMDMGSRLGKVHIANLLNMIFLGVSSCCPFSPGNWPLNSQVGPRICCAWRVGSISWMRWNQGKTFSSEWWWPFRQSLFFLDGSEWWQGAENVVNIPMARGENEHLGFHSMDSLA